MEVITVEHAVIAVCDLIETLAENGGSGPNLLGT